MMNPLEMMKLLPKAKKLIALLQETMLEQEANIKKYNINQKDLKKYSELSQEIKEIIANDKGAGA